MKMEISKKQFNKIVQRELTRFTSSIKDIDIDNSTIDVSDNEDIIESFDPLYDHRVVQISHVCLISA